MKIKSLLEINQLHRTYLGSKRMIQLCVSTFVLRLLILCLLVRRYYSLLICFHRMILRRMIKLLVKCLSEIICKIPSPSPGAGREIILWKLFLTFGHNMHLLENTLKTSNYK